MQHPFASFLYCPKCGSNEFPIHDEKSKQCLTCGFTYYFNASSANVAVVFNAQKELLVCRRAKEPAMGTLDLPGGFADCFETAEEGVIREVMEETCLAVTQMRYLFSLPNQYCYSNFIVHTIDLFFYCEVNNLTPLKAQDDAAELLWIPLDQLTPEEFGLQSVREGIKKIVALGATIFKL